ncbi:MAG: hypothetical protein Q4G68_04875 [Planctomycetia bacterium]|nr:hypothetical protein [Planctomycetia bacterium]
MKMFIPIALVLLVIIPCAVSAQEEDAWQQAAVFQAGSDTCCQIIVATEIEHSYGDPAKRNALAEKSASFLNENSTALGRQFYCLQLRNIGSEAQVPALAKYIAEPVEGFAARAALTNIGGPKAITALRAAFEKTEGLETIGLMDSLARLNDTESLPKIVAIANSDNKDLANAALWTLTKFGEDGLSCLQEMEPRNLALDNALLEAARLLAANNNEAKAEEIYSRLDSPEATSFIRRAALAKQLALKDSVEIHDTVLAWLFDRDLVKAQIAAAHLKLLTASELDELYERREDINPVAATAFFVIHTAQNTPKARQAALDALASDNRATRVNAIRALAGKSDPAHIPQLLKCVETACDPMELSILASTIQCFGKEEAGPYLMSALQQPALSYFVMDCLAALKCYEAIDPMIEMARSDDEDKVKKTLNALATLCAPDKADLTRLAALYLDMTPGTARERVEHTIVFVAEKNPDPNLRADPLLFFLESKGNDETTQLALLPLLGKLGGSRVSEMIQQLLTNNDPKIQAVAMRALCNWPNAEHIDQLWSYANSDIDPAFKRMALRAFIRVATLKSERSEAETLSMLQKAMELASNKSDKNLCLSRTVTVRTLDAANWVASYLADPELAETACQVLVELAHHRFLRQPNKERFNEILTQVEAITTDSRIAEQAKKARLGM